MWMIPKDDASAERVASLVVEKMKLSRFHANVETRVLGKTHGVKVTCVRLKRKKSYCGAHPGPCQNDNGRTHSNASYLEGLDWVGFNAMLNDVLDAAGLSCDVYSYNREASGGGRYFVRRGKCRRTRYPFEFFNTFGRSVAHWTQSRSDKQTCFEDFCGKPPPSIEDSLDGLSGTPGYPCYTLSDEDRYRAEEASE